VISAVVNSYGLRAVAADPVPSLSTLSTPSDCGVNKAKRKASYTQKVTTSTCTGRLSSETDPSTTILRW
jgi:hypothetical protein